MRHRKNSACKITVITACLNVASTIEQTINSVLQQNYPNLEYIIVDGASTDGTLDIINKYAGSFSKVITEPDNGIYDAFNKGLRHATGDIIGILSADDFYAPWTFEKLLNACASSPENDVYHGKLVVIDEENAMWKVYPMSTPDDLFNHMSLAHPATFLPRRTYEKYGLFDESFKVAGDWDLMLRLYTNGASFFPIDDVLTAFRNSGVSSGMTPRHFKEVKKIYYRYLSRVSAWKQVIKVLLKSYGRALLEKINAYSIYASFRDGNIYHLEKSGIYDGDTSSMWESISKQTIAL